MIKTLMIAPYQGLAETVKKINVPEDIELDVTVANLDEGVKAATAAEKQGYELIISRGGTATMIQNAVSIPVVHIDITGYDMLRVFTLLRGIKQGVALVGYANISQGAATICNILEFDVKMVTIESRGEVRGHLINLKEQGYSVVIGDVITVQVAEQVGLRGVLITSGKEAIMDAFEEGRRSYNFFRRVNSQFYYFQETFNSLPFPVILMQNDTIVEKNLTFDREISQKEVAESPHLPRIAKKVLQYKINQVDEIEDENTIYEVLAFLGSESESIVGILFHKSKGKTKQRIVRVIGSPGHIPIIGESTKASQLRMNIEQFATTKETLCIIGEAGTGKYTAAKQIHFERYGQKAPIIVIEGSLLKGEETDFLSATLQAIQQGTVIIKNMESLSEEMQDTLLDIFHVLPETIKIVANARMTDDLKNQRLYKEFFVPTLHLFPLRERKEDIGSFVDYFLAEFHAEEGNETVGMKPEAIDSLKHYDWPANLTELKKVIRELSMSTSANYIEASHVKELMDKHDAKSAAAIEGRSAPVSLEGTLKDIEKRVIKQVLADEGNNQSNAAKRLGINRSTLWRKLKE
ncbi:sigma-54-dependent transcriptional regulator [Lentibacillus sediminis]|uniref:sigma-54-dependent transcriptional regulator n=1 Tax=Lentibacillus sediminis TaxID=1940529 RepID=UPI000C1BD588|nr:sigma-54-dependent transcriptional regulator [Lentibacillus sediminis]